MNRQATVDLVTNAFKALEAEPRIGRAEGMRCAMAALIAAGDRTAPTGRRSWSLVKVAKHDEDLSATSSGCGPTLTSLPKLTDVR